MKIRGLFFILFSALISSSFFGCGGETEDREFELKTLHFKLGYLDDFLNEDEEYQLHVDGKTFPLKEYDQEDREEYSDLFESKSVESHPTHLIEDIDLPTDKIMMLYVTQRSDNNGDIEDAHGSEVDHGLAFPFIYVPTDEAIDVLEDLNDSVSAKFKSSDGILSENKLSVYGSRDIAISIIFHHPKIMSLNANLGAQVIHEHILNASGFDTLVEKIRSMGTHGWYNMLPMTDTDGNNVYRESDGKQKFSYQVKDEVNQVASDVMLEVINSIENDPDFRNRHWLIADGSSSIGVSDDSRAKMKSNGNQTMKINKTGFQSALRTTIESQNLLSAKLKFRNHFLLHLSQYIEFYDANDNPIELTNWKSRLHFLPDEISNELETGSKKFLGIISPVPTFLGVPLTGDLFSAYDTKTTVEFPENAAYAKLMAGELGSHGRFDAEVVFLGAALTSVFEIGIPTFLLAMSSGYHDNALLLKDMYKSFGIIGGIAKFIFGFIWSSSDLTLGNIWLKIDVLGYNVVTKIILQDEIKKYLLTQMTITALEDAEPFVGWALNAVAITTTALMLGQSVVESAASPWIIENRISLIHDVKVNINHDPENFEFPAEAKTYKVFANFSKTDPRVYTGKLANHTLSDPLTVWFNDIPMGGTVSLKTVFYAGSGKIVGVSEEKNYTNMDSAGKTYLDAELTIQEKVSRIRMGEEYKHKQKLVFDAETKKHKWQESDAPTETETNFSATPSATAIQDLSSITLLSKYGILGYSWHGCMEYYEKRHQEWQASCGNYMQNISLGENPDNDNYRNVRYFQLESIETGFNSHLNYGYGNEEKKQAINYTLLHYNEWDYDTRSYMKGWYVRKTETEPCPYDPLDNFCISYNNIVGYDTVIQIYPTYGKFPSEMHQTAVHNSGYMFGVSIHNHKLYSLKLPDKPYQEGDDVPTARPVTGYASTLEGMIHNPSLLRNPRAVKISHDNIVLVLDDIQDFTKDLKGYNMIHGRIKAFTPEGNPVRYFTTNSTNLLDYDPDYDYEYHKYEYERYLESTRTDLESYFLDFNVDSEGNIYVLKYFKPKPNTHNYELTKWKYQLNVYFPTGQLFSTTVMPADKFVMDAWRNIYTLNYEVMEKENLHDDQNKITYAEPSISQWVVEQ